MIASAVAAAGRSGFLFIVSAPSGAGKSTLCDELRRRFPVLAFSISFTTRAPRRGEHEGREYFFVSRAAFEQGIAQGAWAEWAFVHGNYYGTSVHRLNEQLAQGRSILMDIDVQGTRQMLQRFPQAVTIFIMPPSLAELERRLRRRAADDESTITLRLKNAQAEMDQRGIYRHVLINDDLAQAHAEIAALFAGYLQKQEDA